MPRTSLALVSLVALVGACNAIFGIESPDPATSSTSTSSSSATSGGAASHLAWIATSSPGVGQAIATAVAFDPAGRAFLTGAYYGAPTFGSLPALPSNDTKGPQAFVVSFDADGTPRSLVAIPVTGTMVPYSIAVDAAGEAFVTGHFSGSITVGMQTETADAMYGDAFAMKLDASGAPSWVVHFADPGGQQEDQTGLRIAVDSNDCAGAPGQSVLVLAGGGKQIQETKSATILGDPATASLYVMRFDASGTFCAGKGFAAGEQEHVKYADPLGVQFHDVDLHADLVIAPDHAVLIAGVMKDASDLTKPAGMFTGLGGGDVFALKLAPTLDFTWGQVFGGEGQGLANDDQWANAVAIEPSSGDLFVGGGFRSTLVFGTTTLRTEPADSMDVFVARLSGATGEPVWSKSFPAGGEQQVLGLAADAQGDLGLAAYTSGKGTPIDLGGGPLTRALAGLDEDVLVARFDASGKHLWSGRFGDGAVQVPLAVAADSSRRLAFAGIVLGELGLGNAAGGAGAAFVATFNP